MKIVRIAMRMFVIGVLVATVSSGQNPCACGGKNCIVWTFSCSKCGYTFCSTGSPETPSSSDPLDTCQGVSSYACSAAKDPNGNQIVCAQANQTVQCTIRNIGVTGYSCKTGALQSYTGPSCCHN